MVLADLGSKISKALSAMTEKVVIDRAALDELVKELCRALFEADVNVRLVSQLRLNIMKNVNLDDLAAGVNKRKMIQKAVCQELINLLDCKTQPFKPVRKQPNVYMFVGLQGAGKTTTVAKIANYYQVPRELGESIHRSIDGRERGEEGKEETADASVGWRDGGGCSGKAGRRLWCVRIRSARVPLISCVRMPSRPRSPSTEGTRSDPVGVGARENVGR